MRRNHCLATVGIFLIAVAVISGAAGCVPAFDPSPPYNPEVRDWYDLHAIRYHLDKSFTLMTDIDATTPGYDRLAGPRANRGKGWQPIGGFHGPHGALVRFEGTLRGQDHEIRDLFINRPDDGYVGLFGVVGTGTVIERVGVVNADVTGSYEVAGLVGSNWGTIRDSYFGGSVTSDKRVGGLVGYNNGTVSNSYYNYHEVFINGQNIVSIGALFNEDFHQWLANGKLLDVNERLSQEEGYHVISNIDDFKQLLAFGQDGSLRFRLKDDLDLAAAPNFYIPYLGGEFDGNGHKIANVSFQFGFVSQVGLFGYLDSGGRVSEVGVQNVNITGYRDVGGLVGANRGTVDDCHSTGTVRGESDVGGLLGRNRGSVSDSHSDASVTGRWAVGGLIGTNWEDLDDSHSSGNVTGRLHVGGLVGYNYGAVRNSYAIGDVTGSLEAVGGLVGKNFRGTVTNCYAAGSVTGEGEWDVSGVVGEEFRGAARDSYSALNEVPGIAVGGLVGSNYEGMVIHSYAMGNVKAEYPGGCAGGLVGQNMGGTVRSSYATGSVIGRDRVGGLVGWNNWWSTVSESHATGSVTGRWRVGGLVGDNERGTIEKSCSTSSVVGDGGPVGGLVGLNSDIVRDSYATGSVSSARGVGGLVGQNSVGTVSNSYSTGIVTGEEHVGGLIGSDSGAVGNSFWDVETSGMEESGGGTGKSTAEMMDILTFMETTENERLDEPWDIVAVASDQTNSNYTWNVVDGQTYPFLSWQPVS